MEYTHMSTHACARARTHTHAGYLVLLLWLPQLATLASTAQVSFSPKHLLLLGMSLPLIHLLITATFVPLLPHDLPPHCPH